MVDDATDPAVPELARAPSVRHRIEYALFSAATAMLHALPRRYALALGSVIGRLGFSPLRIRRKVVEVNLRTAFPEGDPDWIRATGRAAYAHLGRELVELLRAARGGRKAVLESTVLEGEEHLRAALERGQGAVLITGHYGNWEMSAGAVASRGFPVDVLIQRQRNPLFDRALIDARRGIGMELIDRGLATKAGLKTLRHNRILALAGDQNTRRGGVFLPFFDKPASTSRGFTILAARTGAPILTMMGTRRSDGRLHVVIRPLAPEIGRGGHATNDMVQRYLLELERTIRAAPEQYFWHHRRWKTRPAEELTATRPV